MNKPVGIDMDNTIFNFMEVLLEEYNKVYDDNATIDRLTEYMIGDKLKIPASQFFQEFAIEENFLKMAPYPYAKECIDLMREQGDEVVFVTAGHPKTASFRDELLAKTFPWYKTEYLIVARNKQLINLACLIDDYCENLVCAEYDGFLFTQPWNKDINYTYRFDSWYTLYVNMKKLLDK